MVSKYKGTTGRNSEIVDEWRKLHGSKPEKHGSKEIHI